MRTPDTLSTFLPISVLIALLLALSELSYRNEMPAIWSAGISPFRIVLMLLPFPIMTGRSPFLVDVHAVRADSPSLCQCGNCDFDQNEVLKRALDAPGL